MVTYHNEALSLVLCYNEAPSLVKISCFREHFKNIFSIGYEERRGRVYTVGQDRSVSVTKLDTGTKVSIEMMMMMVIVIEIMIISGLQSALLRWVCLRSGC